MEKKKKTAIIIGAGPAGLTAAYTLLKETDIIPYVFEASLFLGGISRTETYRGNRIDIGGHRFFSKSPEVNVLWRELLPLQGAPALDERILGINKNQYGAGPDPEKEEKVMLIRTRISRIFFLRKLFKYPISMAWRTFASMGLIRTIQAGFGYIFSAIKKREERSLEDFYINRFGKPLYRMFFEDYTEKVWGIHPSRISPQWGAQRVKGLSLSKALKEMLLKRFRKGYSTNETSLIEQFQYPKRGPGQLWETMAERIRAMGGEIHLGQRVTGILSDNDAITAIEVTDQDNRTQTVLGDYFLSSMPVKDLIAGIGPNVPDAVQKTAQGLPYRDFITVGLLLKDMRIKNDTPTPTVKNRVPDCWIYIQEKDVKIGRLQIFNNWSPYMVKDYENTVWTGLEYFCSEHDSLWNMDPAAFIDFAIKELETLGIISADAVLDATHIRVKKAYPAYFGTYQDFDTVRAYLDSFPNLFCIGRNGQHRYNNMDHSMLTSMAAVQSIKDGTLRKDKVWGVNTEEEYHEQNRQ